jgi:hypothetical protein
MAKGKAATALPGRRRPPSDLEQLHRNALPEVAPFDVFRIGNSCVNETREKNIKDGTPGEGQKPAYCSAG